jgi:hypothetical protein
MVMVKPWESTIPHSRPDLGADEADAARGTVAGGHVAQGPVVAAFEAEVAALVGRKYGVATSSGTAALHLVLQALDVAAGRTVEAVARHRGSGHGAGRRRRRPHGVAAVCSFYATKVITSGGEGGMVLTDDQALAQAVRELREYDGRCPIASAGTTSSPMSAPPSGGFSCGACRSCWNAGEHWPRGTTRWDVTGKCCVRLRKAAT